ncbi:PilZ domain-containing protein, partial [Novosphingobium sp.]|uniref:PilZ domain-containing protein n=1 Tax=Novosphingobium sp. TaxID=1874826 RepID=UPI0025EDE76A
SIDSANGLEARLLRRAFERRAIGATIPCRRGTMREVVRLRDLSQHGARLSSVAPLRPGVSIWLQIGNLRPIEALIVWTAGLEAGCIFTAPLHAAVFDMLTL